MKDAAGEPTGVLKDAAMDLVGRSGRARTKAEVEEALRAAVRHAAENGVTSVQDLPGSARDLDGLGRAPHAGELTVRVDYRPSLTDWQRREDRRRRR